MIPLDGVRPLDHPSHDPQRRLADILGFLFLLVGVGDLVKAFQIRKLGELV